MQMLVKVLCCHFNVQKRVHVQYGREEGAQTWAQISAPPTDYHLALASALNTMNFNLTKV